MPPQGHAITMSDDQDATWLAGVDGCSSGWIVVFGRADGEIKPPRVVSRFDEIVLAPERPSIIAIDVPIGLPERSPVKGRQAESAVRALLGDRKSSVFRIPSRGAVYASVAPEPADARKRFFHACKIARETSEDNKGFSKQSFYILEKVVEVDTLLRNDRKLATHVFETHPELAFVKMNGGVALNEPKKKKSRAYPPGLALRRNLLATAGIPRVLLDARPPKGAAGDDMIDAFACLITARRIHAKDARCYPENPPRDEYGLPMAIWA
jgi:predicted RNase H-like nuclease